MVNRMNATKEIKKISVDDRLETATITVEFKIDNYQDLEKFKDKLGQFIHTITGQKKLE